MAPKGNENTQQKKKVEPTEHEAIGPSSNSPSGSTTQSLDRAMTLLDIVVSHAQSGIALPELSSLASLSRPTTHRLVTGLRSAGLVDYNPTTRLFSPAFKLYQMGQTIAARFDLTTLAGPIMDRLAVTTEDTVYLSIRSGDQAICVARREGAFPIKTLTLEVGNSRPLGMGAGNLALLAALPDSECRQVIARNRPLFEGYRNFDTPSLLSYVAQTRAAGYAVNLGTMQPEMAAVGVALRDASGHVNAALSVAATKFRMSDDRLDFVIKQLQKEASEIELLLQLPVEDRFVL